MRPVPPGEILNEEFFKPLGLMANALAKAIGVPPNRITTILKGGYRGHGNPAGNSLQNLGGILGEPANDLGLADAEKALILAGQAKNLDWRVRQAEFIGELPREITVEVLEKLGALLFDPS